MTNHLTAERALRLERYLLKIEQGTSSRLSPEKRITQLIDLYIALLRAEKYEQLETDLAIAIGNASITRDIAQYIDLNPLMKRVKSAMKAIANNDAKKANDILSKIIADKDKIVSDIQANNRKNRKQDTAYNDLLRRIIRADPTITKHIFQKRVIAEKGNGIITNVNTMTNEITTKDGFIHSISGLKDRFYDIKKTM